MPSIGHSALYPLSPHVTRGPQQLAPPGQIFRAVAPQIPRPPAGVRPPFNQVSSLLQRQDQLQVPLGGRAQPALLPLFGKGSVAKAPSAVSVSPRMQQHQQKIVESGLKEWRAGVRESGGSNRGPRIDAYARNAKFGPGYEWCGFFAAFNYTQTGFKYPEHFASYQKARDFFLYRSYTSRSPALHRELDQLRQQQQAQGSTRQYLIMAESPTFDYVRNYKSHYGHVDLASMTHTWRSIPIQPGDIALFSHGHVGQVISYDRNTGRLETVEGNTAGTGPDGKYRTQAVVRKSYDLSKAEDRKRFDGFGRAALGDFA